MSIDEMNSRFRGPRFVAREAEQEIPHYSSPAPSARNRDTLVISVRHIVAVSLTSLSLSGGALASPSSRLVYSRGEGGESCPDEAALRKAVAARVGYDPFFSWAAVTVTAEVRRVEGKLRGRVTLIDEHGLQRGAREIEAGSEDCAELLSSIALAISIALDALTVDPGPADGASAAAPVPDPTPVSTSSPAFASDARPAPPPKTLVPARSKLGGFITGGAIAALGAAPSLAGGGTLGGGLSYSPFELGLEGRYDFPVSVASGGGAVSASLATVSALPCARVALFLGCARASWGALFGESSSGETSHTVSARYVAFGARAGVVIPVFSHVDIAGFLDLDFPVTPTTLRINGADAWTLPAASLSAGLLAVVHFP